MRHPSRRLLAFLGIDRFAGGAEEHELFLTYSVFAIVRKCFMVSPQTGHSKVGALSDISGRRSMTGIEGV